MPWYVISTVPAGKTGPVTYGVQSFANDAAFTAATNEHPSPAGGYPTQAAAQAVADKDNGKAGPNSNLGTPNLPATGTQAKAPGFNLPGLPNIFASITGFHGGNFVIRAAKILIGGALVIIGIAHMTGAENAVMTMARKAPLPV